MKYAFYPGCSLEGTARDFGVSTLAVAARLGIELEEIPGWICCGSTAAHQSDPLLSLALPAQTLLAAGRMNGNGRRMPVAVCCAACYNRLKMTNYQVSRDAETRSRVAQVVGEDYDAQTPVLHLLEILAGNSGADPVFPRIAEQVRRPLTGLKVACYYGCLLTRPHEVTQFDASHDGENPMLMEQVLEAAGATPLDWPHKSECCGASYSITDVSIVHELTREVLLMAMRSGADCIAAACPLCQLNLDMRQKEILAKYPDAFAPFGGKTLPVFYFTQLLGLAMGLSAKELSLKSLVVNPMPLLESKGLSICDFRFSIGGQPSRTVAQSTIENRKSEKTA